MDRLIKLGWYALLAAMVFFALFVMFDKEEFAVTAVNNEGLWQRLNLVFMYLPLAVVALKQIT
ncbi:MAG: hypothetical protein IK142_08090 [Clostridiales bacterium]|nr:hypothetical protein [Clostridiales bacterium]